MAVRRALAALAFGLATLTAGCSSLLTADPTPVPGAAATLTRSQRTPIPTPIRTPGPSPAASASPRVAVAASPSAAAASGAGPAVTDNEVAQVQRRVEQTMASPDLPGIENLLLDHVSLSTAQGGSVLTGVEAATWLRERAASGITVSQVERSTQTLMLQVQTDGWPSKDPIDLGQVSFSLRRYDSTGRPDEDKGDWKIDVIDAE